VDWIGLFLNRLLVPIILSIVFLCAQVYPKKFNTALRAIIDKTPKLGIKPDFTISTKNTMPDLADFLTYGIVVRKVNWKVVIGIVLIAIALEIGLSYYYSMPLTGEDLPLPVQLISSVLLAPMSEELLVRGFLLSYVVIFAITLKNIGLGNWYGFIVGLGLGIVTLIFTVAHGNYSQYQFVSRFAAGLLYGLLYLASDRNLLPPILAHAAANLTIILGDVLG